MVRLHGKVSLTAQGPRLSAQVKLQGPQQEGFGGCDRGLSRIDSMGKKKTSERFLFFTVAPLLPPSRLLQELHSCKKQGPLLFPRGAYSLHGLALEAPPRKGGFASQGLNPTHLLAQWPPMNLFKSPFPSLFTCKTGMLTIFGMK